MDKSTYRKHRARGPMLWKSPLLTVTHGCKGVILHGNQTTFEGMDGFIRVFPFHIFKVNPSNIYQTRVNPGTANRKMFFNPSKAVGFHRYGCRPQSTMPSLCGSKYRPSLWLLLHGYFRLHNGAAKKECCRKGWHTALWWVAWATERLWWIGGCVWMSYRKSIAWR